MDEKPSYQELERWCLAALEVIELGIELMPDEKLAKWTAVRVVQESCPVEIEGVNQEMMK